MTATNATITGTITAEGGKIGKFTINGADSWLSTGSGSTMAGMGGNQAFWAGSSSSNSAPFHVGYDGAFTATNATITGDITANSLTLSGDATVAAAKVSGLLSAATIKASSIDVSSGKITASQINVGSISINGLDGILSADKISTDLLRTINLKSSIGDIEELSTKNIRISGNYGLIMAGSNISISDGYIKT
jgi:hypothetical protein